MTTATDKKAADTKTSESGKDDGKATARAAHDDASAADDASTALTPAERSAKAERIIQDHVLLAVVSGLIPGPAIDVALGLGVQLTMLKRLSSTYGIPFRRNAAKGTVISLLNSLGGVGVGAIAAASLMKTVPGLGTFFGIAGTSVSFGAFTYATGKVFQQHFESGGTFVDLDPKAYRDYFRDMFKRGKTLAAETAEKAEAEGKTTPDTAAAGAKA
jgi:uncharacterized protein (DUF697 family)